MRFRPALTRWRGEGEGLDRIDAKERRNVAALPKRDARMAMLLMAVLDWKPTMMGLDGAVAMWLGLLKASVRGGRAQKVSVYGRSGFRQIIRNGTLDMGVMDG
ncbi:hypothetical protein MRB53_018664 [Persea americana]|uniref:Uncharacterized protein n=1 Tax=Persea americana TaxID=3435 RepID=A0ACC2M8K0_PERAE|nr:hypothetical protein MRB53_018664 [Persea americana]